MKLSTLFAAGALALTATAASAETTIIRQDSGDGSFTIRRHSDRGWHHGWYRDSFGMQRCRTVTIRRENEDGDVTVRRIRRCD